MIIIEGPDNSGKSSLANTLSKHLGIIVHHSGGPPRTDTEIVERNEFTINTLQSKNRMVFDRVPCISDQVYGPLIRGYTVFSADHLVQLSQDLDHPIIYCRAPTRVLMEVEHGHVSHGHDTPEHLRGVMQNTKRIIENYDKLMAAIPHITYDYTSSGSLVTIEDLINMVRP